MPSTYHFIALVGGGTLGFLFIGLVFLPLDWGVGIGLMLFSLLYLVGGTIGFWFWKLFSFD